MTSTIYRRQSMAQLYEKLRAQDDDDDMAWLAQFSPDDKFDEPYVPAVRPPPALSSVSSASPVSSCLSGSSMSDPGFDDESTNDPFDFDSNSDDVDPEPFSLDIPYEEFDPSSSPSLILFQSHDSSTEIESSDPPHIPSAQGISLPQSTFTPLSEGERSSSPLINSPLPILPIPSITSRRTTRSTQNSSARYRSSTVLHDSNEDVYSESDGNGSEDEYVPSPALGSRKRHRSTRSTSCTITTSSQKRGAGNPSSKRPRHSPLLRNVQAASGVPPASSVIKNNPWACPYCKWVQRNHRTPDLKRHIRTHTRLQRPVQWVCCGVPVKDVESYSIPVDAKPYAWASEMMIGGCCKEFSRRDALKRHLDNEHINCVGNFSTFANICEDDV